MLQRDIEKLKRYCLRCQDDAKQLVRNVACETCIHKHLFDKEER